jgi:dTDP-4-dehydrorhamnose 3,5-epimerase
MNVVPASIPGVFLVETPVFTDGRGSFTELIHEGRLKEAGIDARFVQTNLSTSRKGVLRGLHLQRRAPQAKLVRVLSGEVFDVAVDVRPGSPTFGRWLGVSLSEANRRAMFVPEGMLHGFCVTSESATVLYACSNVYAPGDEVTVRWDDADLAIQWPVGEPVLSAKDAAGITLRQYADLLANEP